MIKLIFAELLRLTLAVLLISGLFVLGEGDTKTASLFPPTAPCMTASELAERATFLGQFTVYTEDALVLSHEQPVNFLFTKTVTERWTPVGAGYCRPEAAPSA